MELPHIGQACNICNRNDYLPFKCTSCAKIVCIDHRTDHGSDCPMNKTNFGLDKDSTTKSPGESLKQACDFCRKITLKLELTKCDHCPGSHCLYHRHQVQHECLKLAEDKKNDHNNNNSNRINNDDDQFDENKIDFELLTLRQRDSAAAAATGSSTSSDSTPNSSSNSDSSNSSNTDHDQIWPLHLTPRFFEHYVIGDVIGCGSYAEVRECVDTRTLQRCALKIVNKEYLVRQAPRALANQLQEIRLLRHFNHVNIICMRECLYKDSFIYIALEYCSFNMQELLNEQASQRFSVTIGRNFFRQMCSGVNYLHSLGIVHRDIKPQNLLITNSGALKLIDFGVSHILSMWSPDDLCSNYEGTPLFQSPEVVSGQAQYHGFKVDVWSCGVTLYLMLYGTYPFIDEAMLGLYDKILGQKFEIPSGPPSSAALTDLLAMMLDKDCLRRALIEQVLEHPWLKLHQNCAQYNDADNDNNERCELIDLLTVKCDDNNNKNSNNDNSSNSKRKQREKIDDAYKSMTVLPYLYRHHFPNLPIKKSKTDSSSTTVNNERLIARLNSLNSTSVSTQSDRSQSSLSSSTSSPTSDSHQTRPVSSDAPAAQGGGTPSTPANNDPNVIINDDQQQVEWGTKEQYHLMKTPQIRANRVRRMPSSARRRRRRWHRRRRRLNTRPPLNE